MTKGAAQNANGVRLGMGLKASGSAVEEAGGGGSESVTEDLQVDASARDAFEASNTAVDAGAVFGNVDSADEWLAAIFVPDAEIPEGATITSCYMSWKYFAGSLAEPQVTIYGERSSAPSDYGGAGDISGRNRTTESVAYDDSPGSVGPHDTPSLVDILQEIVDNHAPLSKIGFMWTSTSGDGNRDCGVLMFDNDPGDAPQLHVEYDT